MSQIYTVGRVTADLEIKTSANGNPYVRFNIAERIGSKDCPRMQYLQVWVWGDTVAALCRAGIRKGSRIWLIGSPELETYTRKDGITMDKRLKVIMDRWGFASSEHTGTDRFPVQTHLLTPVLEINGDTEELPE